MSGKAKTGLKKSVVSLGSAFFKEYFSEPLDKGLATVEKKWDDIFKKANAISIDVGMYAYDIKKMLSEISGEQGVKAVESFFSVASRDVKVKILKHFSIAERENLVKQSVKLKNEVAYLRFWMNGGDSLNSPKIRTYGELKKLCDELGIVPEMKFVDSATLIPVETTKGVSFYLECGNYRRGKRVAFIPADKLYK